MEKKKKTGSEKERGEEKGLQAKSKGARGRRETEAKQTAVGGVHYLVRLIKFMDY